MNRNLSTLFPEASACKTYDGAEKRFAKVQGIIDANEVCHCVVRRADGLFIAVAILNDRTSWSIQAFTSNNVCVASA